MDELLRAKGRQVKEWIEDFFPTKPVIESDGTYLMKLSGWSGDRRLPLSDKGRDHLFDLIHDILSFRLQFHEVVDTSKNHTTWGGELSDGRPYHVLLSRGCRGTMSVEVRPGKNSV